MKSQNEEPTLSQTPGLFSERVFFAGLWYFFRRFAYLSRNIDMTLLSTEGPERGLRKTSHVIVRVMSSLYWFVSQLVFLLVFEVGAPAVNLEPRSQHTGEGWVEEQTCRQ